MSHKRQRKVGVLGCSIPPPPFFSASHLHASTLSPSLPLCRIFATTTTSTLPQQRIRSTYSPFKMVLLPHWLTDWLTEFANRHLLRRYTTSKTKNGSITFFFNFPCCELCFKIKLKKNAVNLFKNYFLLLFFKFDKMIKIFKFINLLQWFYLLDKSFFIFFDKNDYLKYTSNKNNFL